MSDPIIADNKPVAVQLEVGGGAVLVCVRSVPEPAFLRWRACGHDHLSKLEKRDLATWDDQMARLTGIRYSGFTKP